MKKTFPGLIKATIWKSVWKLNENLELELVDDSFRSFERFFANLLYLNALNQSAKGRPKFPNNTLKLKTYEKSINEENPNETFPSMKSDERFIKESKSSYTLQLWHFRIVYKIFVKFPVLLIALCGLISRLFKIKLKIYFEDVSFFYLKYPYLVDNSLSDLKVCWEEKIPKSKRQINLVLQSNTFPLDQKLLDSIRKISVAENINIVTFLLSKPGVAHTPEDVSGILPNPIIFEDKLTMIMNLSRQTGLFVVLDDLSLLAALLAKEKVVLAAEPYDRFDFSWGKICQYKNYEMLD